MEDQKIDLEMLKEWCDRVIEMTKGFASPDDVQIVAYTGVIKAQTENEEMVLLIDNENMEMDES